MGEYKCILSIGIRCFTEIYLNELGYKNFSSPFGSLYLISTEQIIYLLKNGIESEKLIHTENDKKYEKYNKQFGFRTIHILFQNMMKIDNNNIHESFHKATFAHHNLNNTKDVLHFNRCFERLNIIKKNKIKTLFCLFYHVNYYGFKNIHLNDIIELAEYLSINFNCHLLVIHFCKTKTNKMVSLILKNDKITLYYVNSDYTEYEKNEKYLKFIMNEMDINNDELIKYDYFNDLIVNTKE